MVEFMQNTATWQKATCFYTLLCNSKPYDVRLLLHQCVHFHSDCGRLTYLNSSFADFHFPSRSFKYLYKYEDKFFTNLRWI